MTRCPETCQCGGTGRVTRTATISRGRAPVEVLTYVVECPRAADRARWYPGIDRDAMVP